MKWAVVILIVLASLLSVSQTILYAWQTPPGYVFPLIHNFVEDYYQYLDIMRQGFDGWWTATSRLTPEVYPRMPVSVFLLALGHVAAWFHLSLPVVYTLARVAGGITLMILVYQLIRLTFQSSHQRFIAFCIVLFSTYFWGWGSQGPVVASLTHAWTELDPIFRWSFVPHHLWSKVGMLGAFIFLLARRHRNFFDPQLASPVRSYRFNVAAVCSVSDVPRAELGKRSSKILFRLAPFIVHALVFVILVMFMGFTNPVVYVTFIPTIFLYVVLTAQIKSKLSFEMVLVVLAVLAAGVVILYHRYLQTNIFPWTSYLLWEQTLAYKVNPVDYAVSLGPTLVLFILAIPSLWRLGKVGRLFIAWAASSWIMLYIVGRFVPVTPERFLGGYQFIPLGIGTAVWIFSLKRRGLFRLGDVTVLKATPLAFARGGLMKFTFITVLLLYFSIGIYASFREHAGYVAGNRTNNQVYVPQELIDAFNYLATHGSPEDVVMAPYEISTMIPGLTGKKVVAGHVMFTNDVGVKRAAINEFFTTSDPTVIQRVISAHNVRWILVPSVWTPPTSDKLTIVPTKRDVRDVTYIIYSVSER
ncbi:hypothetical protein HY949_03765 [Candidatus Gottesmanbacteria bacterium]|nr:hypothetical protein [Candidatus Gottesmanbacteria bacterium]